MPPSIIRLASLALLCGLPACSTGSSPAQAPADRERPEPANTSATPATAATPPHSGIGCDWTRLAAPRHIDQVRTALQPLVGFTEALQGDGVDAPSRQDTLELLRRAQRPLPLGEITGQWQVRSLQMQGRDSLPGFDFAHAYPYFQATIQRNGDCGYRFAKTTGSQRRSGVLYPMGAQPHELAFLGATTVNDEAPRAYDPQQAEHASAGRLVRIGPSELLMILDADTERYELYQLRR